MSESELNFTAFLFYALFWSNSPFWDNEFFWVFEKIFWNCNNSLLVEDTLNLITHFRKEIKSCIFFILYTFFIRFTVYEILRVFGKVAAILNRQIWRPHWELALAPGRFEFSRSNTTSVPNFMLVGNSAQFSP